jgi:hypothetical protein
MKQTLQIALRPSVVKRALKYAAIVGTVLISINHGDAILRGDLPPGRWFRMCLTVLVPYVVSTLSSVGAIREIGNKALRSDKGTGVTSTGMD